MKIVQITSCHVQNSYVNQYNWILHALDDQGRIWERTDMSDWTEIKLPQPASAQETAPEPPGCPTPGACSCPGAKRYACTGCLKDISECICSTANR